MDIVIELNVVEGAVRTFNPNLVVVTQLYGADYTLAQTTNAHSYMYMYDSD